jgi:hypothetical protein
MKSSVTKTFRKLLNDLPASVQVLGLLESDHIYWYWIGAHDEYDELLNRM